MIGERGSGVAGGISFGRWQFKSGRAHLLAA